MHKLALATLPLLASGLFAQGTPEVEPNETAVTATALALGAQGNGAIGVSGDSDFWKITLADGSDLRFWVNPGIGTSVADTDLTLIASDGTTELAFNDDSVSPPSWLSAIVAGSLPAGDYYLRVRSSQSFAPTGFGTYTLDVVAGLPGTYVANGGGGIPTPVTETTTENDPRIVSGIATPSFENSVNFGHISAATPGTGYADPTADYDFFEVNVTRTGTLTMETVAIAATPAMRNTVIFLVDAAHVPLAFDDDSGAGRFSRLAVPVTPGTHYVVIKGWNTGNYVLNIGLTRTVPTGRATVTVQPGGCGPTLSVRQTIAGPLVRTERAVLGTTFYVDGGHMPPNALLIRVIGVLPLASPFNMGPIGAPGCEIQVDPIDQSLGQANGSGIDYWDLVLPLDPFFINLTIEQEIAVIDLAANPLGVTVSNRISSVVGIEN